MTEADTDGSGDGAEKGAGTKGLVEEEGCIGEDVIEDTSRCRCCSIR
jgi:hypothetical protein